MEETAEETPTRAGLDSRGFAGDLTLVACGPDKPRAVSLRAGREVVIGRHASCQLSLASPLVSRFHARFVRSGGQVLVEDLGSRHGTWLSDRRVERAQLTPGASLRLADVVVALTCMSPLEIACESVAPLLPEALYLSPRAREVRALLLRVAPAPVPVLLLGETGTGKELAARELHLASQRKGPLRVLNCAAIPPQLVEATLFGHERGAFTGAERARPSIFEEANGGTLLLDEVGELSLSAQAALLRVIETRRLTRVGSSREVELDVRIVAATHRDLEAMSVRGEFRADLLHRLRVVAVELPPLRERSQEIAALTRHFLARQEGPQDIEPEALSCLEAYAWPGNIRELRNVLARAAALAQRPCISLDDLPETVRASTRASGVVVRAFGEAAVSATSPGALRDYLKSIERDELQRALNESGGNQRRAAALLGLPLRTFERRLRALRDVSTRAHSHG